MNGLFVTRVKLPPFIVTLGTWYIFLSILRLLTGSQSIRSQDIDAEAATLKIFGSFISIGAARITFGVILMIAGLCRALVLPEQDRLGPPCLCHRR